MPSERDMVTFAELVELGRVLARKEWRRTGGTLDECADARTLSSVPSSARSLSQTELTCLHFGYRSQLHTLNLARELGREDPTVLVVDFEPVSEERKAFARDERNWHRITKERS